MKKNTRNLIWGLGLAAGALLTVGIIGAKNTNKNKLSTAKKVNQSNKNDDRLDDDFYA